MSVSCGVKSANNPHFVRDEKLEKRLREQGLTFSTTLDWGMEVNYLHVNANNLEEAKGNIEKNSAL